jgi:hypothetical protein
MAKRVATQCAEYDKQPPLDGVRQQVQAGRHWLGGSDWAGKQLKKLAAFSRMVCVDNRGGTPVVHACQRYFTARAESRDKRASDSCPPAADRCLGASPGWRCSGDIEGALFTCPGGLSSAVNCPSKRKVCRNRPAQAGGLVGAELSAQEARKVMCHAS